MKIGLVVMFLVFMMMMMEKVFLMLILLFGVLMKMDEMVVTNYILRFTVDVEVAMRGWSAREEDIDVIKGDIVNVVVCYYDDSLLNVICLVFIKVF